MRCIIYGCGIATKHILGKFEVDYKNIVFTDTCDEKWGDIFIDNKKIVPPSEIVYKDYDFCMIGSSKYEDEIRDICEEMGFLKSQLIPTAYLTGMWERWKKGEFHSAWKRSIEDENVTVLKNWYVSAGDSVCIIKIENLSFFSINLSFCDLLKSEKTVEIWDVLSNKLIAKCNSKEKVCWNEIRGEAIIKIVIKNSIDRIPWCSLEYTKTKIRRQLESQKLFGTFMKKYKGMTDFYFYDEDYLALKQVDANGTVLDLGANYGQSMHAFYYLTNSQIISVEVVPELYDLLLKYAEVFDEDKRIKVINAGISDKKEELIWYEPENPAICGSFDKGFIEGRKINTIIKQRVLTCDKLDNMFADLDDVWFIKMDVEGLEYQAIKGGMNLIRRNYPVILVEQNDKTKLIAELLRESYEMFYYDVTNDKFEKNRISRLNCWFIPKEEYQSDIVRQFIEGRL